MQVQGLPNKYKIYQDFYFELNGKQISYSEALRLFSQMDESEKSDFEQYYKDETGYEIISANGYNLDPKIELKTDENGELVVKTTKKKGSYVKQSDGTKKYQHTEHNIYDSNASLLKKANIAMKYNIEAIAKKRGIVLDPVWSQFTAEEIVRMNENGTYVPKEVLEIANAAIEANTSLYVNNNEENDENVEDTETKKESYLELIPKAAKKIEKCNKNNEKLETYINKIVPEQQKQEKNKENNIKKQRQTLDEYQNNVKEYTKLQKKIQNGETLTDSETKRYEDLSKILATEKNENDEFQIDKTKLARELNDVNILAVLGEKLADETIEIGETLADCTSTTNYKSTKNEAAQTIGLLSALKAMVEGKALSKEASEVGNDTKEYSVQTEESVGSIAETIDIKDSLSSKDAILNGEVQVSEEQQKDTEENNKEGKEKMPTIVTDKFVLDLIQEGKTINSDLYKQILIAATQTKTAAKDDIFAIKSDKRITTIIDAFYEAEAKRQAEIGKIEQEIIKKEQEKKEIIEEAKKHSIEEKKRSTDETDTNESLNNSENKDKVESKFTPEELKKIEAIDSEINDNNKEIEDIKLESDQHVEEIKKNTSKEKATIDKSMPLEQQAKKINDEYQEKDLPKHDERMDFINDAGAILAKIGTTETIVGSRLIMIGESLLSNIFTMQQGTMMIIAGNLTLAKGLVSIGIGLNAMKVSDDESLIEKADEKTNIAGANIDRAISDLSTVDKKIIGVTSQLSAGQNTSDSEQSSDNANTEDTANTSSNSESPTQTSPTPKEETDAPENNGATGDKTPVETPANNPENTPAEPKQEDLDTTPAAPSKAPKKEAPKGDKKAADKSQKEVDNINKNAEKDAIDSLKIKKNTEKTSKQLTKEAQKLQKQILKDQNEAEKLIKESEEAAKKQEELFAQYETISAENEQLEAENGNNQPAQQNGGALLAGSTMSVNGTQGSDNSDKINLNNETINTISGEFKVYGNVINRNRVKITNFQKSTTKKSKAFTKKTKAANKKAKQEQKAEKNKQQKLQKQLGAVGIAGNVFSITTSTGMLMNKIGISMIITGTGMLSNPITAAEGEALKASGTLVKAKGIILTTVGTYGTIACGVTKSAINIANGNLAAGLISLGTTAVSAVGAMSGTGAAANNLLGTVSNGLSIVSNGAEMVNNIRAVQGKEANGLFGKISTIAGAGSALTGAAASFTNSKSVTDTEITKSFDTKQIVDGKVVNGSISTMTYNIDTVNAFKDAGFLEQAAMIGSTVGSTLTTTSEIMTEFGGENGLSKTLGAIGGTISTLSSIGQLVAKKAEKKDDSNDTNDTKTEKDKKPSLKESKEAKAAKKEEAKDSGLSRAKKRNMTENGASKEYADLSDDDLAGKLEYARETGNDALADNLATEMTKRGDYKEKMAVISENKAETISKITEGIGQGMQAVSSVMNMGSNGNKQGQQKKKGSVAQTMTKRSKNIIKKHKKRIKALQKLK